ncbi:MAG: tRNA (adenosine(37)-N6)-threonylcarbamoyltransferase complex dimerization subunit type 1 TsaB [Terriglobales bacterium]
MVLLAADTSGKLGSIALARCVPERDCEILEVVPLAGGAFSAELVPQIMALLEKQGFGKGDIEAFAVASGPGSFTGLRVGLAAIKALAEVLGKPIAVVSLLEAVAAAVEVDGKVFAALDAGRGQIYAGEFDHETSLTWSERLLTKQEFLAAAKGAVVLTPDKSVIDDAKAAGLRWQEVRRPQSDAIARIGWKKLQAGETTSAEALDANYIRRSDAEIFATPVS